MIQKTRKREKNIRKIFFAVAGCLLAFGASPAFSQEIGQVRPADLGQDVGTPVEEIISAVSGGGLEAQGDFEKIKLDIDDQAIEILATPAESQPVPQPSIGFDPESIQSLEEKGGLSSRPQISADAPTVFNLAVSFFERVVFKKDVEFLSRPKFDAGLEISGAPTFDKDTAGYAIIKKGNQSVKVEFKNQYNSPPIVTATLSLQQYKDAEVKAAAEDLLLVSDVKYIITDATKKGFEIMMDRRADSDIPFSWHALSVDNPKMHKKAGSNLDGQEGYPFLSLEAPKPASPGNFLGDVGPGAVGQSEKSAP